MTLRESLAYEPLELAFGTSGLRGTVISMTDLECYINTTAFIEFLARETGFQLDSTIYLAGDLRDSTPRILHAVSQAARDAGCSVVYCGLIPTPALGLEALSNANPGIMVTGSHIPADRNGIKFYKAGSEVLKDDEQHIHRAVRAVRERLYGQDASEAFFNADGMLTRTDPLPAEVSSAVERYTARYTTVFGPLCLKGKEIVFYQHSAVGRDLLPTILEQLGATVTRVGRSTTFVPIDSENVTATDQAYFLSLAAEHPKAFAIVSTDGDSDRPFVIDEAGRFHRGDVLGLVVARWLGADSAAYPVTASDVVDHELERLHVPHTHTKIGSPHVIAAMNAAEAAGAKCTTGWEVNGGFLIGQDILIAGNTLRALPTRDALIAILGALLAAVEANASVSELFAALPQRFTQAGIINGVEPETTRAFLGRHDTDTPTTRAALEELFMAIEDETKVTSLSFLDGLRITFANAEIIHLRSSGNAPQLRIYTIASSQARADELVKKTHTLLLALL